MNHPGTCKGFRKMTENEIIHSKLASRRAHMANERTFLAWVRVAVGVAVGTTLSDGPPHRSQRAELPHWAPSLSVWRQSADLDEGVRVWARVPSVERRA